MYGNGNSNSNSNINVKSNVTTAANMSVNNRNIYQNTSINNNNNNNVITTNLKLPNTSATTI